jgi:hypothetical protein
MKAQRALLSLMALGLALGLASAQSTAIGTTVSLVASAPSAEVRAVAR